MVPQWCLCFLDCTLWLLPDALPYENTLVFGCVRNSGFLVVLDNVYRPFSGRNLGSSPVHTDLGCSLPCVGRRDRAHSRRVFYHCTDPHVLVGIGPPSGTVRRPVRDCYVVQCSAPVPLVG